MASVSRPRINWPDFPGTLHYREPALGRPAGIAFEFHGRRFTGHELGRPFRLSRILARLETGGRS